MQILRVHNKGIIFENWEKSTVIADTEMFNIEYHTYPVPFLNMQIKVNERINTIF